MSSEKQQTRDIAGDNDMEMRKVDARVVEILNPVVPETGRLHAIINNTVTEYPDIHYRSRFRYL